MFYHHHRFLLKSYQYNTNTFIKSVSRNNSLNLYFKSYERNCFEKNIKRYSFLKDVTVVAKVSVEIYLTTFQCDAKFHFRKAEKNARARNILLIQNL